MFGRSKFVKIYLDQQKLEVPNFLVGIRPNTSYFKINKLKILRKSQTDPTSRFIKLKLFLEIFFFKCLQ